jgi:hypothetical protein
MSMKKPETAGAPEMKLTAAMIEAAIDVIAEDYGICGRGTAKGLVEDIFSAMMEAQIDRDADPHHGEKSPRTLGST